MSKSVKDPTKKLKRFKNPNLETLFMANFGSSIQLIKLIPSKVVLDELLNKKTNNSFKHCQSVQYVVNNLDNVIQNNQIEHKL